MPTDKRFVEYIIEQLELAGAITTKPMMGEYLMYCDGVYFGLVSDNKLFIKPTNSGRKYIGVVEERSAYPGAKPSFYIESQFEDKKWIAALVRMTCEELSAKKVGTRKK